MENGSYGIPNALLLLKREFLVSWIWGGGVDSIKGAMANEFYRFCCFLHLFL